MDSAGRPASFKLSGTWQLVIQLHELYETVLQSTNGEIVTNCLTEGEAAKLNATAKRDAWRHLSAVDFNRNLGAEVPIGVNSKQLVEMRAN
ncbi:hypothetical protein WK22_17645 [Burkholderia multivorans]|nr:hypothetical protein WK22_17645 [Burkholderia multivorans]